MSHDYWATTNKHQKQSRVHFRQYLSNSNEPEDDISSDTPKELEAELLENSQLIKRRFRDIAYKTRERYT